MSRENHIQTITQGHVLVIKVNRPEKYNALTVAMYHQIAEVYALLENDPELRVGLLCAEGPHFTAGLELTDWTSTFASGSMPPLPDGAIDPFALSGPRLSKPMVMAVQGYAYTWAIEMMLNTDMRVAASDTRFAQLEVQRGLYACGGATVRLQKEIGWANAQRYLLTGDECNAQDALRMGLVQQVCEPGQQFDQAFALAEKVAKAAPLAVRGSLASSRLAAERSESEAIADIFPKLQPVMASEDLKEGLRSFVEKRPAVFRGQ